VLYNTLARKLHRARTTGAAHDEIVGLDQIDKIINVDQDPIGNAPSSNPATYTGLFDLIRELFAKLPEAKVRGYHPRRFSFNKPGGRCEACEGNGQKKIEMHFLPDVWVECDVCRGARYNPETLAVKYKEKSIADVLTMRVSEALELFANIPKVRRILQTLADVGLEYLALGQPAPTMSGGEAQRVKLAAELARPQTGRTMYLLDEPTTGLHFDDVRKLLDVLNRLVDSGNTVIVVEHNLDVIKSADWVIDMGPEAGDAGGRVVSAGPPEVLAEVKESHTGAVLKEVLAAGPCAERPRFDPLQVEAPTAGDLELHEVGGDARMPWEVDGPRWHTTDRVTGAGKPPKWEGAILPWLESEIHKLGTFGPTNWNHRTIIEIPSAVKSQGWFLHAMTGQQWFLRLVFRVARNGFKLADLNCRLGLPTIAETAGVETSGGDALRIQVANRRGPWQEVAILGFKLSELDTPAFRSFLKDAAASFFANLKRMKTTPEDVMPWKINGERWHLGEKGFPPGRRVQWDRALLSRLLEILREVEPKLTIDWNNRDAISLRVPGASRAWAAIRTKNNVALEAKFLGRSGQFNLARFEPIGGVAELKPYKADGEVARLALRTLGPPQADALRTILREHLEGFRVTFGRSAGVT
jgi:excinuclease ABC subunit A